MINQQINNQQAQLVNVQRPQHIQPPNGPLRLVPAQGIPQGQPVSIRIQGEPINITHAQLMNAQAPRPNAPQSSISQQQQPQQMQGQMMNMGQQQMRQPIQHQQNYGTNQQSQQGHGNNQPQQQHMRAGMTGNGQHQGPQQGQIRIQQQQQNQQMMNGPQAPQRRMQVQQNMQQNQQMRMQQGQQQHAAPMRMQNQQQQQQMRPQQQQSPMNQPQQQQVSQRPIMSNGGQEPMQMQQSMHRGDHHQQMQQGQSNMGRMTPQRMPNQMPNEQQRMQHGNPLNINRPSPQQPQMQQGHQNMNAPGPMQQQMRQQQPMQHQGSSQNPQGMNPNQQVPSHSSPVVRGQAQNSPQPPIRNIQSATSYQQSPQSQGQPMQHGRPQQQRQPQQMQMNRNVQQAPPHQQNVVADHQSQQQSQGQNVVHGSPQVIRIKGDHAIVDGMEFRIMPTSQGDDTNGQIQLVNAHPDAASGATQSIQLQRVDLPPGGLQKVTLQHRASSNQLIAPVSHNSPMGQMSQNQSSGLLNQQNQPQLQTQGMQNQQNPPPNSQQGPPQLAQPTPPPPRPKSTPRPRNRSKKIAPTADDLPQETDSQTMEQPNQGMTSGTPNGHMPNGSSQQTPKGRGRLNGPSNMPMGQQRPTNGMRNEQNFSPNPKMVQQGKHTVQVGGLPPDLQRAQFNTSQNQQQGGSSNRQPNGTMSFGRNQPSTSQPSTSQSKQPVQMTVIKDAIFSHVNGTAKMTPEYTEYVIGELTRVTHEMEKAGLDSDPRYASTRKLIALVKGEDPSKIETPKPRVRPDRPPLDDVKDALAEPVNETPEERKKRFDGYMELMKNAYPVQEYDIEFPPIDAETIRKEAANYMREDMKNRATYLKENIDKIPEEQRTKAKIEYLGLNLIDLQDKVRKDVEATLVFEPPIEFLANPWSIRRTKAEYALELKQHPDRAALEKKRRVTNNLLLHTLSKHTREFREFHKGLLAKHTKVRKAMQTQISNEAKRKTREEMKNEKLRIQKLISEDEDGYRAMLDDKKDQRLVYLLEQTDGYIESLTDLLKKQQNTGDGVAMRTVHKEFTGGEDGQKVRNILEKARTDEDEYVDKTKTNFEDYYSTAHGIREEIKQQHFTMGQGKEGLKLKPYQLKGLEWMVSLFNNNLNGILADEMGLGKTIQTIAFITYMMEIKKTSGPFLVIVPLSTISNWKNEFDKWAPHVQLLIYKGPKDSRKAIEPIIKSGKFNVLLTTFEYVIREKALLGKLRWKYMIIDEGHRLKNQHCKLTEMLNTRFQCQRRLLITGTPLQNKLPELWALLNFLLPSIFSSCSTFEQWFNAPFATTGEKVELTQEETMLIIRRLHKVLRPFLLRRLKKEVESELPDKTEFVIRCEMSALQKVLYKHMQKGLLLDGKINTGSRTLMNSMVHLRKLCNHPFLFRNVEESCRVFWNVNCVTGVDLYRVAGKLELLDRILPKLQACGHRVLMFFQMTSMMTVIEDYFAIRDINYLRLDGSTKPDERGLLLDKFNAPNSEYFLCMLSTRAGGLGLNLQTADTVIIFDSDWNPHQDMQAQDRAHRIGQKAEVRVFRLITANSVEEKILAAARYKLNVDEKVIQAGKFDNRSTGEERKQILEAIIRSENEAEEDDDIPNDEDINEMLSRSDEEFDLFQKMDQDRYAEEKQTKAKSRLVGDDELPTDILRAASETEYQEKAREEGREAYLEVIPGSRRKRKDVDYSADSMSDEKFLDKLFDGEDLAPERTEPREDFTGEKNITETSSETTGNSSLTFKVPRLVFKLGEEIKRKHKKSESDSDKDDTPTKKHRKHGESKKEKHSSEISTPIPKLKIKWPEDLNNTKDDESSKKKSHRGEGSSSMRDSDNEKTPKKRKHRESEHGGLSDGGSSEKKKKKKHRHKEREEFDSPAKNVERPADDSATTSAASVNSSNPLKIRFKIPDEFREAIGKSSDKKEKSDHKKRDRENETEEERKARKEAKKEKKRLQAAQEEETRIQEKLAKKARKEQRRLEKEKLAAATTETAETAETAGTADQQPTTSIPAPDPNPSTMKVTIIDSDEDEDNPLTWLQDEVTN